MTGLLNIIVIASIVWAMISLLIQWYIAWGGGRRDLSQQSGEPGKGMLYNFTVAMMPSHKETVRLHPFKFAAGMIMHTGAFLAILSTIVLLVFNTVHPVLTIPGIPLLGASLAAALYLLFRRTTSKLLKTINTPDDIFAIALTAGYILLTLLLYLQTISNTWFLVFSAIFFAYLPLGKLRHALFFFIARGDYGRRLGYRGVYPIAPHTKQENRS